MQRINSRSETRCVCETQMPPIMANSNDGQGHKDKYLDTSRKILSQEMLMCNNKALVQVQSVSEKMCTIFDISYE